MFAPAGLVKADLKNEIGLGLSPYHAYDFHSAASPLMTFGDTNTVHTWNKRILWVINILICKARRSVIVSPFASSVLNMLKQHGSATFLIRSLALK